METPYAIEGGFEWVIEKDVRPTSQLSAPLTGLAGGSSGVLCLGVFDGDRGGKGRPFSGWAVCDVISGIDSPRALSTCVAP